MRRSKHMVEFARELRKTKTPWEIKLWRHLRAGRADGHKFKRQVPIGPYIVDFCCNELKLIIELDGSGHQGKESDRVRDVYFRKLGYNVLRFWNSEVHKNLEGVIELIFSKFHG